MVRSVLATLVFAIMAAGLTGALVYRWEEDRYSDLMRVEREVVQTDVLDLERQLAECSTVLSEIGWPETGTGTVECGELNASPADSKIAFYEESRGIAFLVPYNESWGYGARKPEPYIRLSGIDGMLFGPPQETGECEWSHTMQLTFLPLRHEEDVYEDVITRNVARIESGEVTEEEVMPDSRNINDEFYSVRYVVPGNCLLVNYELFGTNYNYVFSACEEHEEALIQTMQSVKISS